MQVIGYMGVPFSHVEMTDHPQYITVRNTKVCLLTGVEQPLVWQTPAAFAATGRSKHLAGPIAERHA